MIFVLFLLMLMLSPICVDTVLRSCVFLCLFLTVGQEGEVICKIQVLQLFPKSPLDAIFSIFCGHRHYPIYDQQEEER